MDGRPTESDFNTSTLPPLNSVLDSPRQPKRSTDTEDQEHEIRDEVWPHLVHLWSDERHHEGERPCPYEKDGDDRRELPSRLDLRPRECCCCREDEEPHRRDPDITPSISTAGDQKVRRREGRVDEQADDDSF